jgi:predicted DNA-binding transcriptional regulator AlpA
MNRTPYTDARRPWPSEPRSSVEANFAEHRQPAVLEKQAVEPPPRPEDQRYVSKRELDRRIPVSGMIRWRWIRDPQIAFPKPVKLGRNGRNFWWLPTILEWERRRTANSPSRRDA